VRTHGQEVGYPELAKPAHSTVSKILRQAEVRPHQIRYDVERRDPDFESKMVQVLHIHREVALLRAALEDRPEQTVVLLSYDEKSGIQAIQTVSPDRPPVPGQHPTFKRDYEYKRLGTVSVLASIDLVIGHVHGQGADRHRSEEFVEHSNI